MTTFYPKTGVIAVTTFAVGGIVGFLLAKNLLQQHYNELAQLDIDDVKKYYFDKYEKSHISTEAADKNELRKITSKYLKPDLHELAMNRETVLPEEEDDDGEEEDEEDPDMVMAVYEDDPDMEFDDQESPYLLSYEEFVRSNPKFKKVDLYYYRFDDVVCDSDDVVMPNPEDTLGWEWIPLLETQTTAFVRNVDLQIDYEIHSFSKSYQDEITARLETDKEKTYRRLARKKAAMDESSSEMLEQEEKIKPKKQPYVRPSRRKIIDSSEE